MSAKQTITILNVRDGLKTPPFISITKLKVNRSLTKRAIRGLAKAQFLNTSSPILNSSRRFNFLGLCTYHAEGAYI